MPRMTPGDRLRAFREQLDLTELQVAQAVEVSQPTYHCWEAGIRRPSLGAAGRYLAWADQVARSKRVRRAEVPTLADLLALSRAR